MTSEAAGRLRRFLEKKFFGRGRTGGSRQGEGSYGGGERLERISEGRRGPIQRACEKREKKGTGYEAGD